MSFYLRCQIPLILIEIVEKNINLNKNHLDKHKQIIIES
jgi:hypothetical protein